ncbi:MAG: capsular polysaccharide biosynthesis protein, partial [Vicingaceae bacterium]
LLEHSEIKKLNWVIQQKNQYIITNELFFVKPMSYQKEYFGRIKKILVEQDSTENRRVFLNRSKKTGRYLENFHEIELILKKYDFEIIDTDNVTLDYQASLFNSIQYLISIHGAGETNIIFAKNNLRFLEINPANRISCQYYWLSKELGIDYYDVILGGKLPKTNTYPEKGFYLDSKKLEEAIVRMINHTQQLSVRAACKAKH